MTKLRERFEWNRAPESTDNSEKGFYGKMLHTRVGNLFVSIIMISMRLHMTSWPHLNWELKLSGSILKCRLPSDEKNGADWLIRHNLIGWFLEKSSKMTYKVIFHIGHVMARSHISSSKIAIYESYNMTDILSHSSKINLTLEITRIMSSIWTYFHPSYTVVIPFYRLIHELWCVPNLPLWCGFYV